MKQPIIIKTITLILISQLVISCSVYINSVVDQDYNSPTKNILIVIPFNAYNKRTVNKFKENLLLYSTKSKDKIDILLLEPKIQNELQLNAKSETQNNIDSIIYNSKKDIVIYMRPGKTDILNSVIVHMNYLAIGYNTKNDKEIWKSKIILESQFGIANLAEDFAKKFYDQLVKDKLIIE